MNILVILQAILSVGSQYVSTPTGQAILTQAESIIMAYLLGKTSVKIGDFVVTATQSGTPVRFTVGALVSAIEHILLGQTGSIQVGVISLAIDKAA